MSEKMPKSAINWIAEREPDDAGEILFAVTPAQRDALAEAYEEGYQKGWHDGGLAAGED
jgi:predicted DNA binding protein